MSESTPTTPQPLLQQAPVVPLDASGFTASCVGTIIFAMATLICLTTDCGGKWVYIFATGTGIGLVLISFTAWHRRHRNRVADTPASVED